MKIQRRENKRTESEKEMLTDLDENKIIADMDSDIQEIHSITDSVEKILFNELFGSSEDEEKDMLSEPKKLKASKKQKPWKNTIQLKFIGLTG